MWENAGLIGDSGFAGGILAQQIFFSLTYNPPTIEQIAGELFGTFVCAAAPGAMCGANANPSADLATSAMYEAKAGQGFGRIGFPASSFTDRDSKYRCDDAANQGRDIETSVAHGLRIVNVSSEPRQAGNLYSMLMGAQSDNPAPPVVREDAHAAPTGVFGRRGPYLYDRCSEVLLNLQAFERRQ
jgi:hypothetical protein